MIFTKIVPVILMILIGFSCRKFKIISNEGINGLKILATDFMLPVLLFNTLATTVYTGQTVIIIGVMFLHLCLALVLGMIGRKRFPSLGAFLPFIVSSFEGGMLGYPLYMVLFGEGQLSNIATLDIANTIYTFTIYLAFLTSQVTGSFAIKDMARNVAHSKVFWGVFLGIVLGVSGVFNAFLATPVGQTYDACQQMLTSAISAIILIVVGYGLSFKKAVLSQCAWAILARIVISAVLLCLTMFLLKSVMTTPEKIAALILYTFLPPTFVVPTYAKTEEESQLLSTTISLYCVFTVLVFVVLTMIF